MELKNTYAFPIDNDGINDGEYPGIISFRPRIIAPLDISTFIGAANAEISRQEAAVRNAANQAVTGQALNPGERDNQFPPIQSGVVTTAIKRTDRGKPGDWQIQLRLPAGQNFNDTISYQNADLGVIGGGAEKAVSTAGNLVALGAAAVGNAGQGFIDGLLGGIGSESGSLAALRVASKVNSQAAAGISSASRVALNPNSRTLFQSVAARSHSFTFKLVPNSAAEVERIKEIIKKFRVAMYPDEIGVGEIAVGYKFPDPFDITMTYKGETVFTKILTSFLTNCQVTYNSAGQGFYEDGGFTDAQITLSFTELRPLNKQDIVQEGR